MSRHAIIPGLALLITATAGAAVDPGLLDLVMPDAKVLFGVRVPQTLGSPFGQYALNHLLGAQALTRFFALTGLDPRRDLQEVLVASATPGIPGDGSDALILVRGTFAPERFIAVATLTGATVSDYHGVQVINPQQPGPPAFAFLDSSTLAIGAERMLTGVIDRRTNQSNYTGPLAQKALDASATGDAWFATVTPLSDLIPATPAAGFDPATLLQSIIETRAGLRFDSNGVTVVAEALTHSDAEARGLAGILKLAAGMVRGTPAAALQYAQVTANGPVTRVTLTVDEQDLERSFRSASPKLAAR
jgi:hypothetical protein